jgi:N-acetyl-anhydromuramyl-L-alanine amidase AmpD
MLAEVGYETENLHLTLKAFQRHFRPARVTGRIDFETARRLKGLADLCAD